MLFSIGETERREKKKEMKTIWIISEGFNYYLHLCICMGNFFSFLSASKSYDNISVKVKRCVFVLVHDWIFKFPLIFINSIFTTFLWIFSSDWQKVVWFSTFSVFVYLFSVRLKQYFTISIHTNNTIHPHNTVTYITYTHHHSQTILHIHCDTSFSFQNTNLKSKHKFSLGTPLRIFLIHICNAFTINSWSWLDSLSKTVEKKTPSKTCIELKFCTKICKKQINLWNELEISHSRKSIEFSFSMRAFFLN